MLSVAYEIRMWMHQESVQSSILFAEVEDVVMEFAGVGALSVMPYADVLVLMMETIEGLRHKFLKWKEDFESEGLKGNLEKTKVVVS